MADFTELKNIVRKGIVQSVDSSSMKARVKFGDKSGMISGDMHILTTPRMVLPNASDGMNKDGNYTSTAEGHRHDAYVSQWIPDVGSMVVCLMVPDGDGEGFILGGIR